MACRPTLAIPDPTAREYIAYWGDVHYVEFCSALGLPRLDYWSFVQRTQREGPYWWVTALRLRDIRRLPSPDTYRSLLGDAHPHECTGPRRYEHYIRLHRGSRSDLIRALDTTDDAAWRDWAKRI